MPSWGIHFATANDLLKKLNIVDKDSFIIGNLLPDAERYVIDDFSIYVPYDISHFTYYEILNGAKEKLPDYSKFVQKYNKKIKNNDILLGYLTHIMTDYYWNKLFFSQYSIRNDKGEITNIKLDNGNIIEANREIRKNLKHKDFAMFDKELIAKNKYYMPNINDNMMQNLIEIEETKYNKDDLNKIILYLKKISNDARSMNEFNYTIFTNESILLHYNNIVDSLYNNLKAILNNL